MPQKKYKTRLRRDVMEAINTIIVALLITDCKNDDDKLLRAALSEVHISLQKKLIDVQKEYTVNFTPVQAMALRMLSTDYVTNKTTYIGNRLHCMANEIHQQFN